MDYLNLVSHLDSTDPEAGSGYDNLCDPRPPCEHPLRLPESRDIGRCIRCQSESELVDTFARMRIRRERFKTAVDVRAAQLRIEATR